MSAPALSAPALDEYAVLEGQLGHTFGDRQLLVTAVTHKSYVNEVSGRGGGSGLSHNERLEFLGDSVLGLMVTHLLMEACPTASEGHMSLVRSQVVSEPSLCELARSIDLGHWLRLGRGEEQSGGRQKPSLLADAYEALFGALYLDSGFAVCLFVARRLLGGAIERAQNSGAPDQKSTLQDYLQRHRQARPRYEVVSTAGPEHEKVFEVAVYLEDQLLAQATGRSKRAAEQAAAERALAELTEPDPKPDSRPAVR